MNIKTRLYILTVLNVMVCVTVGVVGYIGIERLRPQYNNAERYRSAIEAIDAFTSSLETLRADVLATPRDERRSGKSVISQSVEQDALTKLVRELEGRHDRISRLDVPVAATWNVAESKRLVERLANLAMKISHHLGADNDEVSAHRRAFQETSDLLQGQTTESKNIFNGLWQKDVAQTITFGDTVQRTVMTTLLLGVACIIALVLITLRSIIHPIGEVITALGASASEVDNSAQKMSLYAEHLSQSATEQAAAVQESVASMTEMSSMIAQTSDSSQESLTNVRRMAERTQDGNRIMERLASSTEAINQANSQLHEMVDIIAEISGKTSVINDIVFKTQLLSFNASIEAARAGAHGRGFAVVAEEFGSLAEISGKAAKEIQSLLETSKKHVTEIVEMTRQRVSDGLSVSKDALAIFNEIARDTNQITKQIQRISEATREQTIGVQQTSTAMNQMDQAAQRNSLLAGDTLRNASDLSEQSRKLANIMRGLLSLISTARRNAEAPATSSAKPITAKTRVFEVDDSVSPLDLAFLQEAATKLGARATPPRKGDVNADDEDFKPYTGSPPR